jgi:hypothetical protein
MGRDETVNRVAAGGRKLRPQKSDFRTSESWPPSGPLAPAHSQAAFLRIFFFPPFATSNPSAKSQPFRRRGALCAGTVPSRPSRASFPPDALGLQAHDAASRVALRQRGGARRVCGRDVGEASHACRLLTEHIRLWRLCVLGVGLSRERECRARGAVREQCASARAGLRELCVKGELLIFLAICARRNNASERRAARGSAMARSARTPCTGVSPRRHAPALRSPLTPARAPPLPLPYGVFLIN